MTMFIIGFMAALIFSIFIKVYYKKNNVKVSKLFILGVILFVIYVALVFEVTGPGNITDIGVRSNFNISVIPFNYISGDITGLVLNIIMFIPLGVFLPCLWKRYENFINTLSVGFFFSLFIELFQLFNFRATDIDDLLMNTLGAIIGYFIYLVLFKKLFRSIKVDNRIIKKYGAGFIILIMFVLNFFLVPLFNRVIYGYLL